MIDPKQVTKFDRNQSELQEFLLFCIVVAGKNAHQQAKKLHSILENDLALDPFDWIKTLDHDLENHLRKHKIGQYGRIAKAFREISQHDPENIGLETLENVYGIGPKTARFFLLHSRPNQEFAVLDTHILGFLRDMGIEAPKATPDKNKYRKLEQTFLQLCKEKGKTPAEFDLEIWKARSQVS